MSYDDEYIMRMFENFWRINGLTVEVLKTVENSHFPTQ